MVLAIDYSHATKLGEDQDNEEDEDKEDNKSEGSQRKTYTCDKKIEDFTFVKNYDFRFPDILGRSDDHFLMWRDDYSHLHDHILVFGEIESLPTLIECLRHFTNNYICYVSDKLQQEKWSKIRNRYQNVLYFECSFSDKNELARTGINNAKHVILLSWMIQNSNHPDSGMLQIIRIIDEHFPEVKYTM